MRCFIVIKTESILLVVIIVLVLSKVLLRCWYPLWNILDRHAQPFSYHHVRPRLFKIHLFFIDLLIVDWPRRAVASVYS